MAALNDLGEVSRGKSRHRPRNDERLYGGQYPFIQTGDIKSSELHVSKHTQTYNEMGLQQSKLWTKGTLCITIAANIAETAILSYDACFPDSIVGFVSDSKKSDVYYIKYYIDYLKLKMQQISKGTTQDNLSVDKLLSFDFGELEVGCQRKISQILLNYDTLIENNNRRIAILEEMAQKLYCEWFVHFRFLGHENVKMVESEMGMIPEGWKVVDVKEVVLRCKNEIVYKDNDVDVSGTVPVIDQSTSDVLGYHNNKPDFQASTQSPIAIFGDHTCKMQLNISPFSIGSNVIAFIASGNHSLAFIYYSVSNLIETREYKRHWNDLMKKTIIIPTENLEVTFSKASTPFLEQIEKLKQKNTNLRKTRDLLLPRLISGDIDVSELDIPIKEG